MYLWGHSMSSGANLVIINQNIINSHSVWQQGNWPRKLTTGSNPVKTMWNECENLVNSSQDFHMVFTQFFHAEFHRNVNMWNKHVKTMWKGAPLFHIIFRSIGCETPCKRACETSVTRQVNYPVKINVKIKIMWNTMWNGMWNLTHKVKERKTTLWKWIWKQQLREMPFEMGCEILVTW